MSKRAFRTPHVIVAECLHARRNLMLRYGVRRLTLCTVHFLLSSIVSLIIQIYKLELKFKKSKPMRESTMLHHGGVVLLLLLPVIFAGKLSRN
jgi:hypothetical protein